MQSKQLSWQFAWDYPSFRVKILLGTLVMGLIIYFLPDFFLHIQSRSGVLIEDHLLRVLPAHDVSLYIYFILYSITWFFIWRVIKNPTMAITALWGYIFLIVLRMITISMIPLEAPKGLIYLDDPLSVIFYGPNLITKDLFFSGHTATLFLIGFCLQNKREKMVVFFAATVLGLLLLIQHVHYTADVLAAPVFSYLLWFIGKTIAKI